MPPTESSESTSLPNATTRSAESGQSSDLTPGKSWNQRMRSWLKRGAITFLVLFLVWLSIVLIGLIPVNTNFQPSENGVEVFFVSNAVHSDIILPLDHPEFCWRDKFNRSDFEDDIRNATHVAIGWGDKGFFIETPTWDDLKASTAANALLWPSGTCLHVNMTHSDWILPESRSLKLPSNQFVHMSKSIAASFETKQGDVFIPLDCRNYGTSDRFYEAKGSYHLFNTCNSWLGVQLKEGGVKTPWNPSLPGTPFLYFPE